MEMKTRPKDPSVFLGLIDRFVERISLSNNLTFEVILTCVIYYFFITKFVSNAKF